MQHLDEGTIHAWLDGALPANEAEAVERHARECAECAALVADARGLIAGAARIVSALDAVPGGVIPSNRPAARRAVWSTLRLTPLRAALAASVMLVAASVVVARRAPRVEMQTVAAPAPEPAANAPAPSIAAPAAPAAPAAAAVDVARRPARLAESAARRIDSTTTPATEAKASAATVNAISASNAAERVIADSALRPQMQTAGGVAGPARTSAIAARTDGVPRPTSGGVLRLESVVATSADGRALESSGCYQVIEDSAETHLVPVRFALDRVNTAGVPRNVVRTVTPDGRRDSVVAGLSWQAAAGAGRVLIAGADRREAFAIPRSGGSVAERFAPSARPAPERLLRVSRIECR